MPADLFFQFWTLTLSAHGGVAYLLAVPVGVFIMALAFRVATRKKIPHP